jgi:hypothetical protein
VTFFNQMKSLACLLLLDPAVQGRITETELPLAEKSFPGISEMYANMSEKPATFLQLLWKYESERQRAVESAPSGTRRRRVRH